MCLVWTQTQTHLLLLQSNKQLPYTDNGFGFSLSVCLYIIPTPNIFLLNYLHWCCYATAVECVSLDPQDIRCHILFCSLFCTRKTYHLYPIEASNKLDRRESNMIGGFCGRHRLVQITQPMAYSARWQHHEYWSIWQILMSGNMIWMTASVVDIDLFRYLGHDIALSAQQMAAPWVLIQQLPESTYLDTSIISVLRHNWVWNINCRISIASNVFLLHNLSPSLMQQRCPLFDLKPSYHHNSNSAWTVFMTVLAIASSAIMGLSMLTSPSSFPPICFWLNPRSWYGHSQWWR
jgi:hypothetical protein